MLPTQRDSVTVHSHQLESAVLIRLARSGKILLRKYVNKHNDTIPFSSTLIINKYKITDWVMSGFK